MHQLGIYRGQQQRTDLNSPRELAQKVSFFEDQVRPGNVSTLSNSTHLKLGQKSGFRTDAHVQRLETSATVENRSEFSREPARTATMWPPLVHAATAARSSHSTNNSPDRRTDTKNESQNQMARRSATANHPEPSRRACAHPPLPKWKACHHLYRSTNLSSTGGLSHQ